MPGRTSTNASSREITTPQEVRAELTAADARLDDALKAAHPILPIETIRMRYRDKWIFMLSTDVDDNFQTSAGRVIFTTNRQDQDNFHDHVGDFVVEHKGCRPFLFFNAAPMHVDRTNQR